MSAVLLTGATGFVGMEVLHRLIEAGEEVVAPVRAVDDVAAQRRIDETLAKLYMCPPEHRVTAVAVDLTWPLDLGDVADGCDRVVHCAASIAFTDPLEDARAVNVGGTERVADLAQRLPHLRHFVHVSTAYAVGREDGSFRNTYEQSKREAELLLESRGLPLTIARPSIIVGDSTSGWTTAFNVLYWPLQAFARGIVREVAGDPAGLLDVVPIDYVADAICELLDGDGDGGTMNVVAGTQAATVAELMGLATQRFDREAPALIGRGDDDDADLYAPYLDVRTSFDGSACEELLGRRAPHVGEYFAALMDYAVASRWGRRPCTREEARALEARAA